MEKIKGKNFMMLSIIASALILASIWFQPDLIKKKYTIISYEKISCTKVSEIYFQRKLSSHDRIFIEKGVYFSKNDTICSPSGTQIEKVIIDDQKVIKKFHYFITRSLYLMGYLLIGIIVVALVVQSYIVHSIKKDEQKTVKK